MKIVIIYFDENIEKIAVVAIWEEEQEEEDEEEEEMTPREKSDNCASAFLILIIYFSGKKAAIIRIVIALHLALVLFRTPFLFLSLASFFFVRLVS